MIFDAVDVMPINLSGIDAAVSKNHGDVGDIDAMEKSVGGEGVSARVTSDPRTVNADVGESRFGET